MLAWGSAFQKAQREWDREVDEEAARLVESGTPPAEAMIQAVEIVKHRRQRRSVDKVNDALRTLRELDKGAN